MAQGGGGAVVEAVFAAWNRDDIEAALVHLDPDAELIPLRAQLEGTVYRGHDGARRMYEDINAEWEVMRFEVDAIRDLGDRVIVRNRLLARGRQSGVELEVPFGWEIELRDGRIVRAKSYSDPDEPFRQAGVEP